MHRGYTDTNQWWLSFHWGGLRDIKSYWSAIVLWLQIVWWEDWSYNPRRWDYYEHIQEEEIRLGFPQPIRIHIEDEGLLSW